MKIKLTNRGFGRSEFIDLYGKSCSIQESSLATIDAIWVGCNSGSHVDGECLARMHLDREMAAELAEMLMYFVKNGKLPDLSKD